MPLSRCRFFRHLVDHQTGFADHSDPLGHRHSDCPVAVAHPLVVAWPHRRDRRPATGAATYGDWLLSAADHGPKRLRRPVHSVAGAGHPHLQLHRFGDRLSDLFDAVCGAAVAKRLQRHRHSPVGSGRDLARQSLGHLLYRHFATGTPRSLSPRPSSGSPIRSVSSAWY